MHIHQARQETVVTVSQTPSTTRLGGTSVLGTDTPTGSIFQVDSSVTTDVSLTRSITSRPTISTPIATATNAASTATTQPISVRTLIAICVGCGVLLAGLVLFVIWFGSRSRKNKQEHEGEVLALDVSKSTSESHLKAAPPHAGFHSTYSESSHYSQSTARKPLQGQQHSRRPTAESFDGMAKQDPFGYRDEQSFLPKQAAYGRHDMAPISPQSGTNPNWSNPKQAGNTSVQQSPRSTSAQAIVRPYVIGSHPFASPGRSQGRPSIEHNGNYTVATAASDRAYDGTLGLSDTGSGHNTFAGAGARPGYNAYGLESRQAITSLNTRPSLESIRSAARKASVDQTAVSAATDFVMGGPTAVGGRSRNNSTSSSHRGGGGGGYTYAGGTSSYAGGTSSLYGGGGGSVRSGKDGSKEKYTKEERAKEMAAMNSLIAALDESAAKERKRKNSLAEAAGVGDRPSSSKSASGGGGGSGGMRRKDMAVRGSYPLPPPEVFRAALTTGVTSEDDVDDDEIERWRRR